MPLHCILRVKIHHQYWTTALRNPSTKICRYRSFTHSTFSGNNSDNKHGTLPKIKLNNNDEHLPRMGADLHQPTSFNTKLIDTNINPHEGKTYIAAN